MAMKPNNPGAMGAGGMMIEPDEDGEGGEMVEFEAMEGSGAFLGVGTNDEHGSLTVDDVVPNSAAAAAGLKDGDVVQAIGGQKVETSEDLVKAIHTHKPGEVVTIGIVRDGKPSELKATLGDASAMGAPGMAMKMRSGGAMPMHPEGHMPGDPMGGGPMGGVDMRSQVESLHREMAGLHNQIRDLRQVIDKLVHDMQTPRPAGK
jgi:membrane-associated protease RseP (regulator of RpoE activity)